MKENLNKWRPWLYAGALAIAFLYGIWGWLLIVVEVLCIVKLGWMADKRQQAKVTGVLLLLTCIMQALLCGGPSFWLLAIAGTLTWCHWPPSPNGVQGGESHSQDPANQNSGH